MPEWFAALSPTVQAAIIAAVVGVLSSNLAIVAKHVLESRSLRNRLEAEAEYEQRRTLKAAISKHLGHILELGERLDHRLWNLYSNNEKGWLAVNGNYTDPPYYFRSTVFRFLAFFGSVRAFFNDAIYLDPRYASGDDLAYLRQLKSLEWAVTDVALFREVEYNEFSERDHLFRGTLHAASECVLQDNRLMRSSEFDELLATGIKPDSALRSVMELFDGLSAAENRYRWDRLVVLHLLVMAFMASFGYDMQRPTLQQFREVAGRIRNPAIAREVAEWLPKLGLTKHPAGLVVTLALRSVTKNPRGLGITGKLEVERFLSRR